MCRIVFKYAALLSVLMLMLSSCEKSFDPSAYEEEQMKDTDSIREDSVVWHENGAEMLLSGIEIKGIVLAEVEDPAALLPTGWRIPTLAEGRYLHTISLKGKHSSERYLCYDYDNETWYSFLFDNQGSITKAGQKTKYTLCGVKTSGDEDGSVGINFNLILHENWEEDSLTL